MNNNEKKQSLCISIVVYKPNVIQLVKTLESLEIATLFLKERSQIQNIEVVIINNGPPHVDGGTLLSQLIERYGLDIQLIEGHGNVGYGRGHNLAIKKTEHTFYLVLNPDVVMAHDALLKGLQYLNQNESVGLVAPSLIRDQNNKTHLCKRYPDLLTLIIRGLCLENYYDRLKRRINHYEIHDLDLRKIAHDVHIVSGCFMLFKTELLKNLGGFDPQFFLYFEDFDLSIRAKKIMNVVLLSEMKIEHYGGAASKKGIKHVLYFIESAIKFFNVQGWRLI